MKYVLFAIFLAFTNILLAQNDSDSTANVYLQPIEIKQYFNKQSILKLTTSSHTLSHAIINSQSNNTLTSALNNVSGIRMEERSPGSYRLGMRGSLIRSPFGVRNTKIYIDEFPLTDAGGNTYLNVLDPLSIENIHIIKGPDGSLFGANSGGVIRFTPIGFGTTKDNLSLQISMGSFAMINQNFGLSKKLSNKYQFSINQSYYKTDGYRDNSALDRKTIQTTHLFKYNTKGTIKLYGLYANVNYQTPGGLNLNQYNENPRLSRPAAGPNPSAIDQKAAIYNKTYYSGIGNDYQISKNLSHYIGVYGSYTDFENPFITNYEYRIEKNLGLRTFLSYTNSSIPTPIQFQFGMEIIKGWNSIDNFDNNKGITGNAQAKDLLDNKQLNLFSRVQIEISNNWSIEGSLGLNTSGIYFKTLYPEEKISEGKINFDKAWMPRLATSYSINNHMALRASISKGYSPPTLAEVRSSDNTINTSLLAEKGTNYEIGYKLHSKNRHWILDIAAYDYRMNDGIVRRLHDNGIEYYINAGQINQKGLEITVWKYWDLHNKFLNSIQFNTAFTYNHYRFGDYSNATTNYSNNKVTSVPDWILSNTLILNFIKKFQLNIYHNHTSTIPLDDANTIFADKYDLIQAKLNWKNELSTYNIKYNLFVGVDNLLNQKYSLGNDINAFGGRYFNAAPTRNFYLGLQLSL